MPNRCRRCGSFVSGAEPGTILADLDEAIAEAEWITKADAATVAVLRKLAARLDQRSEGTLPGMEDAGNPAYDAQVALRYFAALLLSPESRGVSPNSGEEGGDLVASLRAIASGT